MTVSPDLELIAPVVDRLNSDVAMSPEAFQVLFGALIRAYSRISEGTPGHVVPYSESDHVRPTDALRTAAGLLRESDISSFELAMMMNL
jgi:hypothetical protein